MTRQEYNSRLQEMQQMGFDTRCIPIYEDGEVVSAEFHVFWDGQWHPLGRATPPFSETAEFTWDDEAAIKLSARFARDILH